MADNLATLGTILTEPMGRDAVHVAIAPVVAAETLYPGDRVGLVTDGYGTGVSASATAKVGIIDPFLQEPVRPGQRCWLFLLPGTITSLRHQWVHPSFPPEG